MKQSAAISSSHSLNTVYWMLATVVMLWGVNVVMIKLLIGHFPPLALAAIRLSVAVIFLLPAAWYRHGIVRVPRAAWPFLICVTVFSIYLHQIFLAIGLSATSGSHTALILGLNPLFTTILASLVAREPLSRNKGFSIAFGLSAILLIVGRSQSASAATLFGDTIITISMLTAVIGYMFIKKAAALMPVMVLTAYSHALASAGLLITAFFTEPTWAHETAFSFWPIAILLFSGWINTGLGALWWNTGIHSIGASTTSLFLNGVPIAGMFASAMLLHENLTWHHYLALLLVLTSVSLGTGAVSFPHTRKAYTKEGDRR